MSVQNLIDEFNLPVRECPMCRGDGYISGFRFASFDEDCPKCWGKGYIPKRKTNKNRKKKDE